MARTSHYSRFEHPNNIECGVQSVSASLCSFLLSPLTSSLYWPIFCLSCSRIRINRLRITEKPL
jgi:hypothetical protein